MKKHIIGFFLLQVVFLNLTFAAAPPPADDEIFVSKAVLERIRVNEDVTPETTELLGERIDLNSGSLTFQHTDVVFPGPAGLDIIVSRSWRGGRRPIKLGSMADWALEIPRIQTTVVRNSSGEYSGSWGQGEQCSGQMMPWPFTVGSLVQTIIHSHEYYNGVNLIVPGKTYEKLLSTNSTPDNWRYLTQSNWRLTCIDLPDGSEGFKAQSPDGITYIFDKLVYRQSDVLRPDIKVVALTYSAYLYASRIEDRFGNYINFSYEGDQLQSITASDGRSVSINYNADGVVERISSVLGAWTYQYSDGSSGGKYLSSVILPDGSNWSLNLEPINIWGATLSNGVDSCQPKPDFSRTGTIKHPYGIEGTFVVKPVFHGRTGVPMTNTGEWKNKHCYLSAALSTKRLVNLDGTILNWSYTYTQNKGAFESFPSWAEPPSLPNLRSDFATTDIKGTTVVAPDNSKTIHQFYRKWDRLDGQELRREYYDTDGTTLLSRTDNYYAEGSCLGNDGILFENSGPITCKTRTIKKVTTEYGGDGIATTYTTEYKNFNSYDTPTLVEEYNSINSAWRRYTRLGYEQHDAVSAEYLLVNVPTTVEYSSDNVNWTTVSQNTYHSADGEYPYLPNEQKQFGAWRQRVPEYHASGEVRRIEYNAPATPAGTTWIEMEDYFRGLPQTFRIPNPEIAGQAIVASQSVNEDGTVRSSRDFKNVLTGYQYDEMRRLSYRDNPAGWNDVELEFLPVVSGDLALGMHLGQYKRVIEKSNHVRTLYFDGLLRPVLESKKDTSTNKTYYRNRSYDAYGNLIFESHWSTSPVEPEGVIRTYDGLNRLKSVTRTGDGGTSLTTFLSSNRTRVEDARGNETTTSFLAYGSPTRDMPVKIEAPENVTTTLSYNLFDRLVSVTQGGITQTHYYDSRQRLCRMNRPETGSSVYAYDDGGQLSWEAKGQNLSGSGCLHSSVGGAAKVIYGYNHQAQISFVNYPDATPDLSYSYDNNGRLHTLESAAGPQWTYNHNELGLLDDETLEIDGQVFFVDYTYDGNGSLLNIRYPSGKVVAYNPNAFGQPTRAGAYATDVVYYPNGTVDSFIYGNGLSHNTDLNDIQLPYQRQVTKNSSNLFSQTIHYDLALNIDEIIDNVDSYYSLSMTYDGLDRLDTAAGPWGLGDFGYDVLGNIDYMTLGEKYLDYSYDNKNRLASVSGAHSYTFTYDNLGNVTSNGRHSFVYNLANQMVIGGNNQYLYDGHNRRVKVIAGTAAEYSVYTQAGKLLYRYNADGTAANYIYLNDTLVAKDTSGPGQSPPTASPVIAGPATTDIDGQFDLSWSAVSGARFYLVQHEVDTGHWQAIHNGPGLEVAFSTDTSGSQRFRAAACNAMGCGAFSPIVTVNILFPPATPASITVPTATDVDGVYSISWSASSTASTYTLREQKDGGSWSTVVSQSGTSKSLSGKGNGNYRYQVQACNNSGCSGWRSSGTFSVLLPPPTPGSISVPTTTDADGAFSVSWSSSSAVGAYTLQQQIDGGSWEVVAVQSETSKSMSGRGTGSYRYRVQACNNSGCSGWRTSGTFAVLLPPPTPGSINVPSGTDADGAYTISWSASSTGTSYTLQEQKNGGSWSTVANQSGVSKSLSGRGNGTYKYQVRACNDSGCSSWRGSGTFSVLLPPPTPGSISVPTATDADGAYSISWSTTSTATSYTLQEQKNSGSWSTVATQSGVSKSLSGRGNGTYRYQVRACNNSGCSGWRLSGTFSVLHPPSPPSLSAPSSDGDGSFTVSWGVSSTATSYNLQQRLGSGSWSTVYSGSSRSHARSNLAEGSYSYRVRACNGSGCGSWSSTRVVVVDYPQVTAFNASPSVVIGSGTSTLSWTSANATHCTLDGRGSYSTSGSLTVQPIRTSTYTIACVNGSKSASKSISVVVKSFGKGGI